MIGISSINELVLYPNIEMLYSAKNVHSRCFGSIYFEFVVLAWLIRTQWPEIINKNPFVSSFLEREQFHTSHIPRII